MVRATIIGTRRETGRPTELAVEVGSIEEALDVARERGLVVQKVITASGRTYRPGGEDGLALTPSARERTRARIGAALVALSIVLPPVGLLIGVPLFLKDRARGSRYVAAAFVGGFAYGALRLIWW